MVPEFYSQLSAHDFTMIASSRKGFSGYGFNILLDLAYIYSIPFVGLIRSFSLPVSMVYACINGIDTIAQNFILNCV